MSNKTIYKNSSEDIYEVGEEVQENGHYVCVPCGYQKYLRKGFRFPHCINCLEKHEKQDIAKGLELWEKFNH